MYNIEITIADCIKKGCLLLDKANIENSKYECLLLLKHILLKDTVFLYSNPKYPLHANEYSLFLSLIQRRCKLEPLQYILGNQEFMGLNFKVTPDVLIPRQDTEILVETILKKFPHKKNISVLDIGTGSGCIAISIAYFIQNATVLAVDISNKALEIAFYNASSNNVVNRTFFLHSDLFDKVKYLNPHSKDAFGRNIPYNKFDLIVSNPPYISSADMLKLDPSVKDFEPHLSLYGGTDGLDFYRKIISQSNNFLNNSSIVAFEVGYDQALSVAYLLEKYSFGNIDIIEDLNGIKRVVLGKKK